MIQCWSKSKVIALVFSLQMTTIETAELDFRLKIDENETRLAKK